VNCFSISATIRRCSWRGATGTTAAFDLLENQTLDGRAGHLAGHVAEALWTVQVILEEQRIQNVTPGFEKRDTGKQTKFLVKRVHSRDSGGDAIFDVKHITLLDVAPLVDFPVNSLWDICHGGKVNSPVRLMFFAVMYLKSPVRVCSFGEKCVPS